MGAERLANAISCHAWGEDCATLAVCPNSHEIHIYEATAQGKALQRTAVLTEHSQLVSSLDWGRGSQFVSCSHDSTAFVWSRDGSSWTPELVRDSRRMRSLAQAHRAHVF
jgi:WD40 repeat protein